MRILCGILCVILIVFAVVQYNDPDFLLWAAIYGVAAVWTGIAAFAPRLLKAMAAKALLGLSIAVAIWGTAHFFPAAERWWDIEVWWPETGEPAREGMGMMIVLVALIAAFLTRARRA